VAFARRVSAALAGLFLALVGLQAQAPTRNFLWKASNARGVIYLAGSVHLLTPDYYPLDPAFDRAFDAADLLVEELDMGEVLAPTSQLETLRRGMLPAGQSLDKAVSPDTYAAVVRKFKDLGMPVEPMKQFKPWLLSLTLQGLEWQKAGFIAELGLDRHFYDRARAADKRVQGLETLAFQLARFDDMPPRVQDRMLAQTLKEIEATRRSFVRIAEAWRMGDAAAIENIVLVDLRSEPEMYQRLLVDRNRAWLPALEALLARPSPAFVVVGAAHLVGADGLLQLLKAGGCAIEQL
jgi:uncharacterized protein YbaP (TraB family)